MAVLAAQGIRAPTGGIDNTLLSIDIDQFEAALWPPHQSDVGRRANAALATHFPVSSQTARVISTQKARSFDDDYYHRIHNSPRELPLGNVVSTQSADVYVWNAHLVARTLNAIDGVGDGILVEGQPAAPLLFQPLTELIWQLSVTPDSQPQVDTTIDWIFDNGESPGVHVTAQRIVAWAFAPDWADGITEQLEWLTEILRSESAAEQRRSLRIAPRRTFSAPMLIDGRERQLLDLALFGWGARLWALPIWPDIQLLSAPVSAGAVRINCATTHLDFHAGGLALLRGDDAFTVEVAEVLAVDATGIDLRRPIQQVWPAGSRLYPARPAQLVEQPQQTRLTDMADSLDVEFLVMEPSDWPEIMPATLYRGWPVLETPPDESEDITSQYERLLSTLDSGSALPLLTDIVGRALPVRSWRWLEQGRAQRAALRSLLYALRGQQKAIWIPSHADDLTPVATIASVATTIDIAYCGYTRFGQSRPGRRDIRIELLSGVAYHRRITGSTEISTSVERISIDVSLGANVEPSAIMRISWLVLSRGSSDQAVIDHQTDSEGVAACAVTFRGVRDDEF
jgi:hypothetical protein